jgi:tetratricopeptide (TPR) repeat protein
MISLHYLLTAALLIAAPPDKTTPSSTWDGKVVLVKQFGVKLELLDMKNNLVQSINADSIEYRVLADRDGRVQVKTYQGVTGWVNKSDVLLVDDAILFFSQRIQKEPNDADAYTRRAWSWKIKGEPDAAIKDFSEAVRIQPSAANFANRAVAYHVKKDYDKALADYAEALRLAPQMTMIYNNRGNLWAAKKDYDKAIEDYTTAVRMDPKFAVAYANRAIAHRARKDHDRAIEDYNKLLELDPINVWACTNRAFSWSAKKEYEKALADYDRALKLDPKHALACNDAAWLLATCPEEKIRDGKRAVELAKQAVSLMKNHPGYLDTLAAAYAEIGNFDEAVRVQEQALQDATFRKDTTARDRLDLYKKKQPYRQPD